jgi:hypothetical protein
VLYQEQRAGIVPARPLANVRGLGEGDEAEIEDDEIPHARGPEEIGMEDTGPQAVGTIGMGMQGIDVEAAVGRRLEDPGVSEMEAATPTTPKREADEEIGSVSKRVREEAGDEKMVLVDADGRSEQEPPVGEGRENVVADVIEHTAI